NSARERFNDLEFPAADARDVAARFQREGGPLYRHVEVRTLTENDGTLGNVRAGFQWLERSVRPGQIDTAVVFLSRHGLRENGRYYFAPYDFSRKQAARTGLTGMELREALRKLSAKAVFLFVDTCHSGGLIGKNQDLANDVKDAVYVMASSGAREKSYEDPR